MSPPRRTTIPILLVLLVAAAGAVFFAGRVSGGEAVIHARLPQADATSALPSVTGNGDLPLVVIDAGHGGHDPGAAGEGVVEKDLVLGLALSLRDELTRKGIARVALTRADDRYLVHAERFEIARRLNADMFLSIHADSAGEAGDVAGASIYTLSNAASSEAARRFAARENAADRVNGVEMGAQSDSVSSILVDLSQRRTQEQSNELAGLILRNGQGAIRFHPQPRKSAALKVLRAPDIPSVLFESGFITNAQEARNLTSDAGRRRFAEVMARAIQVYFARHPKS